MTNKLEKDMCLLVVGAYDQNLHRVCFLLVNDPVKTFLAMHDFAIMQVLVLGVYRYCKYSEWKQFKDTYAYLKRYKIWHSPEILMHLSELISDKENAIELFKDFPEYLARQ